MGITILCEVIDTLRRHPSDVDESDARVSLTFFCWISLKYNRSTSLRDYYLSKVSGCSTLGASREGSNTALRMTRKVML